MKVVIVAVLLCLQGLLYGREISLRFNPIFGGRPFEMGRWFHSGDDSVKISALKFYVTNIMFYQNNDPVDIVVKKHHLVDLDNPGSLLLEATREKNMRFNRISFCIGVDSLTNMQGVQTGDLDPTNGMYWTWQSGFINFKIEGQSNKCPARNNEFIFHIGGYQYPNNTLQPVSFEIGDSNSIIMDMDILQLLNQLQLSTLFHIMSPGSKAVEMAQKVSTIFKVRI
ncbi:MAG: MbnP family protein [Bacteroidota bacterium]